MLYGTARLELMTRVGSEAATRFYPRLGWRHDDDVQDRDGVYWACYSKEFPR